MYYVNKFWEPSVSYKNCLVFTISRLIVSEFPGRMKNFLISKETEAEGISDICHLCSIKCNIIIIKYKSQSIDPKGAKVWVILDVKKYCLWWYWMRVKGILNQQWKEMTNTNYVFMTCGLSTKARVCFPALFHALQFSIPSLLICQCSSWWYRMTIKEAIDKWEVPWHCPLSILNDLKRKISILLSEEYLISSLIRRTCERWDFVPFRLMNLPL